MFGVDIPYLKEWEIICQCTSYQTFQQSGYESKLTTCRFRSICWKILLHILPIESSKWLSVIRSRRNSYESLRTHFMVAPGANEEATDLNINNPLSQDEHSSWNQYFEDSETKKLIRLDVSRTFPEVQFFHSQRIQDMMVSILFCYARKHPQICYIQGMHEILAPLTFIINSDHQHYSHAIQDPSNVPLLQELMDQTYLEHDSYILFETVMSKLSHWYEDGQPQFRVTNPTVKLLDVKPFQKPQDSQPTTMIVKRLIKVHDELLQQHEPLIYKHLNDFEILPQLYGIRWARLMFGREFSFKDLFTVWDAIFADTFPNFLLVEYLIVALLANVKDQLLVSDYLTSLKLLMAYPKITNAETIIRQALYLREPDRYPLMQAAQASCIGGLRRAGPSTENSHVGVSRSTSLPRSSKSSGSVIRKLKSSESREDRRSSITFIHSKDPLRVIAYNRSPIKPKRNPETVTNGTTNPLGDASVAGTTRPGVKEKVHQVGPSLQDRPMDEMRIIERSPPIRSPTHPKVNLSGSSDEDVDPSYPQKNVFGSSRRISGDKQFPVVSPWHSQMLLSNFKSLEIRLRELNIDSDLSIRTTLGNMRESMGVLFDYKSTMGSPRSPPAAPPPSQEDFHPLMLEDDE